MASKADIVDAIADKTGLSKRSAGDAYEALVDAAASSLRSGDRVSMPGFGTFAVNDRKAREGRNPATGAKIKIAASKVVKFRAGKELKGAVNKKRKK